MTATLIPVVGTGPINTTAVHGFSQTGGMWREVAQLSGLGVVVPDLPGHGSAWPGPTAWEDAVAAVTAVMGTRKTVLVGYSQGARVALGAALEEPASIRHLVLISGRTGLAAKAERVARRQADAELAAQIEEGGVAPFVDEWLKRPMFSGLGERSADWRQRDRTLRLVNTAEGLAAALIGYGLGAMPFLGDRLADLAMPVTVVVGETDSALLAVGQSMLEKIPQGSLRVVPGVGHSVVGEAPQFVADLLAELVADVGG